MVPCNSFAGFAQPTPKTDRWIKRDQEAGHFMESDVGAGQAPWRRLKEK
jgi:hypothetical protein